MENAIPASTLRSRGMGYIYETMNESPTLFAQFNRLLIVAYTYLQTGLDPQSGSSKVHSDAEWLFFHCPYRGFWANEMIV